LGEPPRNETYAAFFSDSEKFLDFFWTLRFLVGKEAAACVIHGSGIERRAIR
jgi:hypothetical protein